MNNTFRLLSTLAIVLIVASCGGRGRKAADETGDTRSRAAMTVELSDSLIMKRGADTVDFGRVREGEVVTREIMVRNVDDKPLVITRIDLTCGCIAADYPKQPLRPGDEGEIRLAFDSKGLGGWIYKTVLVQTSLSIKPYVLVVLAEIE